MLLLLGMESVIAGRNSVESNLKMGQSDSQVNRFELSFPFLRGSESLIRHAYDPKMDLIYVLDHGRDLLLRINSIGAVDTLLTEFMADDPDYYLFDISPDGTQLFFWEEELGKVFKLQLSTLEFYQVDNTTVEKLMRGHTAILCPDNLIYTFSGYGLWEEKNFMLYFDENVKGWLKINHKGPRPPRSENAFMAFEHGIDRFHVLIPKTQDRKTFLYYQFDRYNPEWRQILEVEIPSSARLPEHIVVAAHTHRLNPQEGLFHLMGEYFFRMYEGVLYRVKNPRPDDLLQTVYYYSPYQDLWIQVGIVERDQFLRLNITRIPVQELTLEAISQTPLFYRIKVSWIMYGVIGLTLWMSVHIIGNRRKENKKITAVESRIELAKNAFGVQIYINGQLVSIPDSKLAILWNLIYSMVEENQTSLSLTELNRALFGHEQLNAHISRVRSKLIRLIQEQVGSDVLWIEKNTLDKRLKLLRINPELIQIKG